MILTRNRKKTQIKHTKLRNIACQRTDHTDNPSLNVWLMPEYNAQDRVEVLRERAKVLHARSEMLRKEAVELCFTSHRLRRTLSSFARNKHVRSYTNHHLACAHNPTNLEIETNLAEFDSVEGVFRSELIRIRTPGFDRNPTRKIIKPEI